MSKSEFYSVINYCAVAQGCRANEAGDTERADYWDAIAAASMLVALEWREEEATHAV